MVTDLITQRCDSANEEWTCRWQSDQLYDVLHLKVARSFTVAERMHVVMSDNEDATPEPSYIQHKQKVEIASPCTKIPPENETQPTLIKRPFYDMYSTCLNSISKTDSLSIKFNETIARFKKSTNSSVISNSPKKNCVDPPSFELTSKITKSRSLPSRLSSPQILIDNPGYVRRIIEKFSNLSNTANPRAVTSNYSEIEVTQSLPRTVNCKIVKTPVPVFSERVNLERNVKSPDEPVPLNEYNNEDSLEIPYVTQVILKDGSMITEKNTRRVLFEASPNITDDLSNANVISEENLNENRSDENSNSLSVHTQQQRIESPGSIEEMLSEKVKLETYSIDDDPLTVKLNDEFKKKPEIITGLPESDEYHLKFDTATAPDKTIKRQDSIVEVIYGMNGNITPSKIIMSNLPDTDFSFKYSLDSTNMSLIYSLTPTPEDDSQCDDQRDEECTMCNENLSIDKPTSLHSSATSVHDEDSEFIWQDIFANKKNINETIDLSPEIECASDIICDEDHESNNGSDILELPKSTILELKEINDESFKQDISKSADEILADLRDAEIFVCASNIVDEVLDAVSRIDFTEALRAIEDERNNPPVDHCNCNEFHDSTLAQPLDSSEQMNGSVNLNKGEENFGSPISQESCEKSDSPINSGSDDSVVVIDEIVHHIVNKRRKNRSSRDNSGIFYSKLLKESTNIGIVKEMQTSFEANNTITIDDTVIVNDDDEQSSMIIEFSSFGRSNLSENSLELNFGIENDEEKKNCINKMMEEIDLCDSLQSIDHSPRISCVPSINLSSSDGQDIVDETTDNDTKSDNSKEERYECSLSSFSPRDNNENIEKPIRFTLIEYEGVDKRKSDVDLDIMIRNRDILDPIPEEIGNELEEDVDACRGDDTRLSYTGSESNSDCISSGTYTISGGGDDPDKASYYPYNADISDNMDDTRHTTLAEYCENFSPLCFDTTANLADISATTGETSWNNTKNEDDVVEPREENVDDSTKNLEIFGVDACMTCSYDTNEFIKLERQISDESDVAETNSKEDTDGNDEWHSALDTSPLNKFPRYEDTTLYRVVSRINLTDTIMSSELHPSIQLQSP